MTRVYSREHMIFAVRLLALRLGRSPLGKDWRNGDCKPCFATILKHFGGWDRFLAAADIPAPAPIAGWQVGTGRRTYWTPARVREAMIEIEAAGWGGFPRDPKAYDGIKKGRPTWPTSQAVRALGGGGRGAWKRALVKAGIEIDGWSDSAWTKADEEYLLENAGLLTLKKIGFNLGRSWAACKRRLYDLGVRARDARGYYTASVLAQEHQIPLKRIYEGLRSGRLIGHRPQGRPYWQIDPESIEKNLDWLLAPKKTHKSTPPETMDYYKKHGLKRNGQGKIIGRREVAA